MNVVSLAIHGSAPTLHAATHRTVLSETPLAFRHSHLCKAFFVGCLSLRAQETNQSDNFEQVNVLIKRFVQPIVYLNIAAVEGFLWFMKSTTARN
jgi:hypothetical protein